MFLQQTQSLLPKKLAEGVALNHASFQHQLSRLKGFFRKLLICKFSPKISKLILGGFTILFLSGYQPTLTLPPFRQNTAQAEFAQQQAIETSKLSSPFILPHPGYISTKFSSWHPGIDIATGLGMPIRPIAPGKVIEVSWGFWGLGHYIALEHEQGFKSLYGHMGKIFVKKDEAVSASAILGEVGMTGRTSGPHTHLEVSRFGQYIDPQTILPNLPDWPASAGVAPAGQNSNYQAPIPTPTLTKSLLPKIKYEKQENTGQLKKLLPLLLSANL